MNDSKLDVVASRRRRSRCGARTVRSSDGNVDCRACSGSGCRPLARITLNGRPMRKYIALMFEVTAVVCLIAWVVVVTDFFWSRLPPDHQTLLHQRGHISRVARRIEATNAKKVPPPLVGQRGEFPPLGRFIPCLTTICRPRYRAAPGQRIC